MNKHEETDPLFRTLSGHAVIQLRGRDALAFAQAQCMNDVAALADRQWQWNGWLTPKGRVIALFAVLRRDAETFWIVLADADAADIASRLQRFVFRSRVRITVPADVRVAGAFREPDVARGAVAHAIAPDAVELDLGAAGGARTLRIARAADDDDAMADARHDARWKAFDLAHGFPRLADAQRDLWTPQQLSLDRLRAFSVGKGCYPGQEIVARTHFLGGAAKRGLALLSFVDPVSAGDEVVQADRAIGRLVSVAPRGERTLALSVLASERDASPLRVGGQAADPLDLLDGLAR